MVSDAFEYVRQLVDRVLITLGVDPGNVTYDAVFDRLLNLALSAITVGNVFALIGGIFLIATFVVRTIVPIRVLTIVSIVFFLGAAALSHSVANFFLYLLALPINIIRLVQLRNLVKKARSSAQGTLSLDWLKPYMTPRSYQNGEVLFRKGDAAEEMFLTVSGKFLVTEIGVEIPPERILGELGFLSPNNNRTQSVECIEGGEVLSISYDTLREIYFQNPEFGYFFLRLTSDRLLQNFARLEAAVAETSAALEKATAGPESQVRDAHGKPIRAVLTNLMRTRLGLKQKDKAAKALTQEDLIRAARRRRQALSIVERYANYSAVSGFIPLPLANVATIAAVLVRMVRALCQLYGVQFKRNRAYAVVIGLMGGVMPTGLASVATSTMLAVAPGFNLMGLAVFSVTASAYTREIGHVLVDHFESGATLEGDEPIVRRTRRWRDVGLLGWARAEREWARAIYG